MTMLPRPEGNGFILILEVGQWAVLGCSATGGEVVGAGAAA